MRLDNRLEKVNPQKEAFIISMIYIILGYLFTSILDSKYFIAVSAVLIYFVIYDRVKRLKRMNTVVYESLEELSETTKGLVETQEKLYMEKLVSDNIIKNSTLVIYTWDLDYKILSFNPYAEKITGYKEAEVIGKSWVDLFLYDDEKQKVEDLVRYLKTGKPLKNSIGDVWRTKDGRDIELIWTDSPIVDDNNKVVKVISIGTDITEHKNLVRKLLNQIVYYDSLTGLPNRISLEREGRKIVEQARMNNQKLAFLYLDIDNFKEINDRYGHLTGDKVLEISAELIKNSLRKDDFVARYGGDEFLVLLNIKDPSDLKKFVDRIKENLNNYNLHSSFPFRISFSIGYDVYDYSSGMSKDQFLNHIDALMYQNKKMNLALNSLKH